MTVPSSGSASSVLRAASPGIEVQDATVTYRSGLTAVWNATFEIPTGTITALVGVNGSGKSTLFKAIMGFVRLARGSIRILGLPVAEALARVNMSDFRKRQIGELSGGQKKRVFLARALAQDGRVILLDEPFTGVDVKTEDQIIALLRELRDEGRVILVSTHNLGSVPEFCDRTVLIKGTVLAYGPTVETFTQANLEKAFGGVLRHFVLAGARLHDDDDKRGISVFTDDERPLVFYGEEGTTKHKLRRVEGQ